MTHRKLDNDRQVFFYEQEFYVLSNFSAFQVHIFGIDYSTSEHAYQASKFLDNQGLHDAVCMQRSAHSAFTLAQELAEFVRGDWYAVKLEIMQQILTAKARQHEYVRRKLLETGDRELIEDSWRDGYWGWGEDRTGQNMLGRLWEIVRIDMRNEYGPKET